MTWRDLFVIVEQALTVRDPLSPLCLSFYGEDFRWGLREQLSAAQADALAWLVWSKTEDAAKGRNKPRPIPRPGVTDEGTEVEVQHFGSDPVPLAELDAIFGWDAA